MWFVSEGLLAAGGSRAASGSAKDQEPLKKAKTPQGRFDSPEEKSRDVLESENEAGSVRPDFTLLLSVSIIFLMQL